MIFDQVLARFRPHTGKQSSSKHKKRKQVTSATKAKFQQPLFQASEHLNTTNKLNQALQEINKAVQQKTATDQQLLLKAEILLRKEKFRKAKVSLTELSSQSQDQKTLNTSKHLLEQLPHLQQQSSQDKARTLVSDLHNIAETYQTKLSSLPAPDELTPDFDITLSIRRESRLARSSDLPCLSHDLIERTLQSGDESPWLLHDKALSLNMMGQQQAALKLLADLKKTTGKEKLTQSINKNIEAIQKNPKNYQLKSKLFFAKQIKIAARRNHLDTDFIPESRNINKKTRVKFLAFRKARAVLSDNPQACLDLVDAILAYFQGDLAALLLRGEAIAALKNPGAAMEIWTNLARSDDKNIAQKASELVSQHFSRKARAISKNNSADAALAFFIKQHLKLNLVPMLNKDVKKILQRLDAFDGTLNDPELEHHQLQLLFNTQMIDCLEARLREQGRLGGTSPAQKPGAIGKTASKAG